MALSLDVLTPADAPRVAAVTPFTTIDFPGKLSAVVFLRGCPWRCIYCHNSGMRARKSEEGDPSWESVYTLLKKRAGLLDGVVFSGGEPCMDPALPAAVRLAKELGYAVGLHTAGGYPRHLKDCVGLLDWVGLDVKADPEKPEAYDAIAGIKGACRAFKESFDLLREAGVKLETRTTAHPDFLSAGDILSIGRWLNARGVDTYALQIFRKAPGMETPFDPVPADWPEERTLDALRTLFPHFTLRRL